MMAYEIQVGNLAAILLGTLFGIIAFKRNIEQLHYLRWELFLAFLFGVFLRSAQLLFVISNDYGEKGGLITMLALIPLLLILPFHLVYKKDCWSVAILYFSLGYSLMGLGWEMIVHISNS